jgi:chromosomal replication initiation ATPase DnaA
MNISDAIEQAKNELLSVKEITATPEEIAQTQQRLVEAGYSNKYAPQAHKALAEYVVRDGKGDKRGLFLYGKCGTGKTHFLQKFIRQRFFTANIIQKRYMDKGANQVFEEWVHGHYVDTYVSTPPKPLIIDDIGTEPTSKRFGETREILEHVISMRYSYWQQYGVKTYITSNMTGAMLDAKYGRRITDRIKEMCFPITFEGESARGNQ